MIAASAQNVRLLCSMPSVIPSGVEESLTISVMNGSLNLFGNIQRCLGFARHDNEMKNACRSKRFQRGSLSRHARLRPILLIAPQFCRTPKSFALAQLDRRANA